MVNWVLSTRNIIRTWSDFWRLPRYFINLQEVCLVLAFQSHCASHNQVPVVFGYNTILALHHAAMINFVFEVQYFKDVKVRSSVYNLSIFRFLSWFSITRSGIMPSPLCEFRMIVHLSSARIQRNPQALSIWLVSEQTKKVWEEWTSIDSRTFFLYWTPSQGLLTWRQRHIGFG